MEAEISCSAVMDRITFYEKQASKELHRLLSGRKEPIQTAAVPSSCIQTTLDCLDSKKNADKEFFILLFS